ncbi:hypothetical protein [Bdellovibrio sp. GT3]|uniref:hypothetical protein n=1 Tax=Bdellovibrio sp. GT3 TaxID=3136282 RepID=UPI0030F0D714
MKRILITLSLLLSAVSVFAQTENTETFEDSEFPTEEITDTTLRPRGMRLPTDPGEFWIVGLTSLQWNEKLSVTQGATTQSSNMSLNGAGIVIEREFERAQWGWSIGAVLGSGRANSGPFDNDIKMERESFKIYGLTPRAFWKLTDQVNLGGSAFIYHRNLDLPSGSGVSSSAAKATNVAILADMSLRLFTDWDFYQAIGPLDEGAYMWKIGVNYRF